MPKDGNYGPRGYGHQKLTATTTGKTPPKMDYEGKPTAGTGAEYKKGKKGGSGYKSVAGSPGAGY